MVTLSAPRLRSFAGAAAAVFIVGIVLLAMDQGHLGAAPPGVVEVGELRLIGLAQPGDAVAATAPVAPVG
jgi:hypothetical protein